MKRQLEVETEKHPSPTVAFYAHKGGVGKTTACLSMAVCASQKGLRVCILDCDPQQNATAFLAQWQGERRFDYDADYRQMVAQYRLCQVPYADLTKEQRVAQEQYALQHTNLYDLLMLNTSKGYTNALRALPHIGYAINEHLTVVAAHPMLSAYELLLGYEVAVRQLAPNHMVRLTWLMAFLLDGGHYDMVLLDLAPANSFFNQMALASCSHFVVPLTGDKFSMQSLDTLDLLLVQVRENFSQRMDPVKQPRLPQLLCMVYGQYTPGKTLLPMQSVDQSGEKMIYKVSDTDAERCLEIQRLLYDRAEQLHHFMDISRVAGQLVLVTRAIELHQKLGHANLTVYDEVSVPFATPFHIAWLGQRQGYEELWRLIHTLLFSDRPEWA